MDKITHCFLFRDKNTGHLIETLSIKLETLEPIFRLGNCINNIKLINKNLQNVNYITFSNYINEIIVSKEASFISYMLITYVK